MCKFHPCFQLIDAPAASNGISPPSAVQPPPRPESAPPDEVLQVYADALETSKLESSQLLIRVKQRLAQTLESKVSIEQNEFANLTILSTSNIS